MRAEIRKRSGFASRISTPRMPRPRGGGPIASTVASSRPVTTNFSTPLPRWSITPRAA
ncbi:MAG TPA: hypothetical protein VFB87_00955 [Gaiellaceae bacterium]|nr:hypothetical protein [Gaiellaceae bacterium]